MLIYENLYIYALSAPIQLHVAITINSDVDGKLSGFAPAFHSIAALKIPAEVVMMARKIMSGWMFLIRGRIA